MDTLQTILIVDDESNIRNGIKYIMNWKEEGYLLIDEAENGIDALEKIKKNPPNIVITDLRMPKMGGIELTQILKKDYPEISFFILSSYDDFQSVSQSFKNGAVDYILKPKLTKDILLENLKKVNSEMIVKNKAISQKLVLQESFNRFLSGFYKENISQFSDYLQTDHLILIYYNLGYTEKGKELENYLSTLEKAPFVHKSIQFLVNNIDAGLLISFSDKYDINRELKDYFYIKKNDISGLHFMISKEYENIYEILDIFNYFSTQSRDQLFFYKNKKIIIPDDLVEFESIKAFKISDFLKELLDKNFLLSLSRIENYFNNLIISTASPHDMKQQASSIFYTLISRIEEEYPNDGVLYEIKVNFIQTINKLNYLEDFSEFILNSISQIRVIVSKHLDKNDSTLTQIKQHILKNYQTNLSLADLADKFHFNYNYLSVYLSANLDMSFPDYIKKIRMSEAKNLLVNSDLSLSEISFSVGYSDLSYFSKTFKKEFKITPSNYRRNPEL